MNQWFVLQEAEVRGPFTPKELLTMVRRGTVTRETKLRKDDSPWFHAHEVGGLFEAAVKPTIVLHCPGCQSVIPEPPCMCPECGRQVDVARREVIQNRIGSPSEPAAKGGVGASMQNWLSKVKKKG
ncbi:MAG: DUF4339 domain-containing protein [Planctomycetaceae bacterium]